MKLKRHRLESSKREKRVGLCKFGKEWPRHRLFVAGFSPVGWARPGTTPTSPKISSSSRSRGWWVVRMAVAAGVVASQVATAEAYSLASASAHEVHVEAAAETAAEAVADSAVLSCLAKCAEPPAAHGALRAQRA